MAYQKRNFKKDQLLTADDLNKMDDQIAINEESAKNANESLKNKLDKTSIEQTTGIEEDKVMSQAAATIEFNKLSEAIDNEETARNAAITAERNRAVARENEIEGLFTLPTQEAVNAWLDAHPEATTTVQDASLEVSKFTDDAKKRIVKDYVTPEMFGAVGDGVTDDTDAIQRAVNRGKKIMLNGSYIVRSTINSPARLDVCGKGVVRYYGDGYLFECGKDYSRIEGIQLIGNNSNGLFRGVGYSFNMINTRISNFKNVLNFDDSNRTFVPYLYFEGVKTVEVQTFIESVDSINNCVMINCTFNCVVAIFNCYSCLYEDLTMTGCIIEKVKNLIYYNGANRLQSVNLFGGYYEDCTLFKDTNNWRYSGTVNMIGGWLYDTNVNTDFVDGAWITSSDTTPRKLLNIVNGGDSYCLKINICGIEVTRNTDDFRIAEVDQSVIGFIRCTLANSRVGNDLRSLITFTDKERIDTIVNTVTGEQHALPIKTNIILNSSPNNEGEIGKTNNLPSFKHSQKTVILAPILYGDNTATTKRNGKNFYTCFAVTTDNDAIRFKNPNGSWYKIGVEYDQEMNTPE